MENHTQQFEQAFSDFLDRLEYDQAESAIFLLVRAAFSAGWHAARGEALPAQSADPLLEAATKFGWDPSSLDFKPQQDSENAQA